MHEKHLVPSDEIKELESYENELKKKLEEETTKWHSRWPEQEECCMILKLELNRAQAELNWVYQEVEKRFESLEHSTSGSALVDIPCATRPIHESRLKSIERGRSAAKKIVGDLIAFDSDLSEGTGASRMATEDSYVLDDVDLLTEHQELNQTISNLAIASGKSDILVDLSAESLAEMPETNPFPKAGRMSHDLSVLITEFSVPQEIEGRSCFMLETPKIWDIGDIVGLLSKYFLELMNRKSGSSNRIFNHEKSELEELNNLILLMQPLYDIGLAIRKRQIEIDSGKPRAAKDQAIISKGNSAAHHAQVLAEDDGYTGGTTVQRNVQWRFGKDCVGTPELLEILRHFELELEYETIQTDRRPRQKDIRQTLQHRLS